jgi:hypothetical protein
MPHFLYEFELYIIDVSIQPSYINKNTRTHTHTFTYFDARYIS